MSDEKSGFNAVSGELSILTADGWKFIATGVLTLDISTKTDKAVTADFKLMSPEKITIQELQDLAVDEVSALVSDFDHGYSFSARLAVKLPVDAVSDISLAEFIFIDVEVHRADSHPFKTVLPLMYSHGCGFRFMFGEDGDSDTPLSAEAFWYFMFACALDYCEATRG